MSTDAVVARALEPRDGSFHRWVMRVLIAALAVVSVVFAYFGTFRQFQGYDDEGYLLVAVQHLLDGRRLYDDIVMVYGPAYFGFRWLIHGLFGFPVGNDVVRITSIVSWLATAAAYFVVARRLCKPSRHAVPLAVIATVFTVFHLRTLAHEPGHPQELAVLLVATALCFAPGAFETKRRALAFGHGCIAGALILVKANLGAFFAAATVLAWAVDLPRRKAWGLVLLVLVSAAVLVLPFMLLRSRFQDAPAVILCTVVTAAAAASLVHALRTRTDARVGIGDVVAFALGVITTASLALAFIAWRGSSLSSVLDNLFVASRRFATELMFTFKCDWKALSVCAAASAIALFAAWRTKWTSEGRSAVAFASCKVAFGSLVLYASVRDAELLIKYAVPWAWLVLVPGRAMSPAETFARRLLCFTAVLQVLQIFPVPGTQVNVGTAPMLLIAAVCFADALAKLEPLGASSRALLTSGATIALASVAAVGWLGWRAVEGAQAFGRRSRIEFNGSHLTRVPEWQAVIYRWLVDNLEASSDTFLSVQGQNSMYSWTGRKPASSIIVSTAWNLFDDAQHKDLIDSHRPFPNFMVVDNPQVFGPGKREGLLFFRYIDQEMTPLARLAQNTLLVRKGRDAPPLVGCAWWIEPGVDAALETLPPVLARQVQATSGMRALRFHIPSARVATTADRVEMVEVMQGSVLGGSDSATADHRVQMFDAMGEALLPGRVGGAPPDVLCDPRGGFILVPTSMIPERTEFPGLRFSASGERLLTLPIVQRARRR